MGDAPPPDCNQVDELAVDFMRETMSVAANNLTRAQLFQILPQYMSQYELAFVRSCINEADHDRKMDPIFECNKVFGLQLNGQPYPAAPSAHAEAPAPTFTLDGHRYCTTQGSGYICIKAQPEGTPNSQVAEIEMEGGGIQCMVHTSIGHMYHIPNEDIIMQHFQATLATQLAAAEEHTHTNSNGCNRNNSGPFISPNPEQQELLDHLVTRPTVSSNVNTKVLCEMQAIIRQTHDPCLALAALKDSF
jgi:hypothetical protein